MEKFEKHIIEKSQGDEALLKRVVGLENTANAHQNMMLEIEKASADRSQEIEMELDDYRKSNKEDLRSIRKYIMFVSMAGEVLTLHIIFFSFKIF